MLPLFALLAMGRVCAPNCSYQSSSSYNVLSLLLSIVNPFGPVAAPWSPPQGQFTGPLSQSHSSPHVSPLGLLGLSLQSQHQKVHLTVSLTARLHPLASPTAGWAVT